MCAQLDESVRRETCAGGVVFKREEDGLRYALILDPYGKWAFPKGHVEPGETIIAAAIRETTEETGIDALEVVVWLGRTEYRFRERRRKEFSGATILKTVHYYLMEAAAGAVGRPQESEGIRRIAWMTAEEAAGMNHRYPVVRTLLSRAARHLLPFPNVQ